MIPLNNKILVSCDVKQKSHAVIGGISLKLATVFDTNYRERSPVICIAQETKGEVEYEDVLLCHHNLFYMPSPHFIKDDLFAIPYGNTIFAILDKDGNPKAVCGNLLAEELYIETLLPLPPEKRKKYDNMVKLIASGYGYNKGQIVFTRPSAAYTIVYFWNGEERIIVKINSEMILGYLK